MPHHRPTAIPAAAPVVVVVVMLVCRSRLLVLMVVQSPQQLLRPCCPCCPAAENGPTVDSRLACRCCWVHLSSALCFPKPYTCHRRQSVECAGASLATCNRCRVAAVVVGKRSARVFVGYRIRELRNCACMALSSYSCCCGRCGEGVVGPAIFSRAAHTSQLCGLHCNRCSLPRAAHAYTATQLSIMSGVQMHCTVAAMT